MAKSFQDKFRLNFRQWLRWGGTLVSAALFIWLVTRQDWGKVWEHLQDVPPWAFLLAWGLYFVGMLLNALRWLVLLRAARVPIPVKDAVKIVFAGSFVSNFLPSTIGGDALRFVSLLRFSPDRLLSLASIVLDRVINLTAFLTVLPFSITTFGLAGIFTGEINLGVAGNRLCSFSLPVLVTNLFERLAGWYRRSWDTFSIWLRQPWWVLLAFVISWFSILVIFLAIWMIARGLGIQVTLRQVMGVTALTYLATLLPISVNGYGLREVLLTALYTRLGASLEQATSLAVITRFMSITVTLPGALWVGTSLVENGEKGRPQKN